MRLILWPLLLLVSVVLADVEITSPKKGASYSPSGGTVTIKVEWKDDGNTPKLSEAKWYALKLNEGPNSNIKDITYLKEKIEASSVTKDGSTYSVTTTLDSSETGDGQYYIQVYAAFNDDASEYSIHYSPRFSLKSMGGTSSYTYTDSTQPTPQTAYTEMLAYTQQTGLTRTAPMQMQPSTTVTATTWSMQFQTSAVTYYSTFRKNPQCHTTLTPGWSYTLHSGINRATAQPLPIKNGGWYNPKKRQSLSTRKINYSSLFAKGSSSSKA